MSIVAPLSEGAEWFHKATQPGNGLLKVVLRPE
jgi:L-iditol 2-dehydrogenase